MVVGGGVCSMHGGRAPQVAAKREARIVTATAQLAAGADWEERDPGEALMAACADADALVQRLKRQLATSEQIDQASLTAFGEWIDRVGRLSKVVIDARIDERRTRLAEHQGVLLVGVIRAVLADFGLSGDPRVNQIVSQRLREVSAGPM